MLANLSVSKTMNAMNSNVGIHNVRYGNTITGVASNLVDATKQLAAKLKTIAEALEKEAETEAFKIRSDFYATENTPNFTVNLGFHNPQ
jgi:ATP-dependent protease ClpP protease subunit